MLDEHTQNTVIRGLREGCRDAWATLYDAYSVDLWRYVARLLGPDESAVGDVVQEAFIDAARGARQFDASRGSLWSWLTGIAHHRVSAYWRQSVRQTRLQRLAESGAIDVRNLFDGEAVGALADEREIADFVRGVLAEISADHAALLTAKYLDGLSMATIAEHLGGTVEAIKSKLARARQEFRTKFEFMTKAMEMPANQKADERVKS